MPMETAETFWAYGIVPGAWSPPQPVLGVDDRPVETIGHDGIAVLASRVPGDAFSADALQRRLEDLATLAELAHAHNRVLHSALATTDVLPFRICTLYADREAVARMLRERAGEFESVLARLHDMTEWGVKGFLAAEA